MATAIVKAALNSHRAHSLPNTRRLHVHGGGTTLHLLSVFTVL